jgi:hypothetical protein
MATLAWKVEPYICSHRPHLKMQSMVSCLFFSSFFVLCPFVLQNLVIAVIVDNFVENSDPADLVQDRDFCEVAFRKMVLDRFIHRLDMKLKKFRAGQLVWAPYNVPSQRCSLLVGDWLFEFAGYFTLCSSCFCSG